MLTGEIRNKVDKIWSDIWAGGISNPLTVIEQLTYLMFVRSLDEKELENESFEALSGEVMTKIFPQDEDGQAMRWSKFKTKDSRLIYEIVGMKVFPFIKAMNGENTTAFSRYMQDAMFLVPTPQILQKMITGLDELYEHDIKDLDTLRKELVENHQLQAVISPYAGVSTAILQGYAKTYSEMDRIKQAFSSLTIWETSNSSVKIKKAYWATKLTAYLKPYSLSEFG